MHLYFLKADLVMTTRGTDATKQLLYFKYLLHDLYKEGQFFWSWSYGLGGDVFAQFNYYYSASIFFLLSLLFNIDSITDVVSMNLFMSILKLFLAMYFLFLLLQYHKRSLTSSMIGALLYGGTATFAIYSLILDFMVDAFVLLPLLVLAFDYTVERKRMFPFIIVMAVAIGSNFYFAFIHTVYIGLYAIYKYFELNNRTKSVKDFLRYVCSIAFMYICSIGLAAFSFLPGVYQFLKSDRLAKEYIIPYLFTWDYYVKIPKLLFLSFHSTYSIGLAVFSLLLITAGWTLRKKELLPKQIFSAIIILLLCIPFVYSLMNGLSAMQNRWFYIVGFTVSYIAAYFFDELAKAKNKRIIFSVITLTMFGVYMVWRWQDRPEGVIPFDQKIYIAGVVAYLYFLLYCYVKKLRFIWGICLCLTLLFSGIIQHTSYYDVSLVETQNQKEANELFFKKLGYDNEEALQLVEKLSALENDFGRTIWDDPANEFNTSMYYGYKSHSTYHSLIPKNVHRLFKEHYNTLHQGTVSVYQDYDHRLYLETVFSNQFYITMKDSQHVPYGYTKEFSTSTWDVYKNDFHLPIGFMYPNDAWMTDKTFTTLNFAERDQSVLHAAVIHEEDLALQSAKSTFNKEQLSVEKLNGNLQDIMLTNIEKLSDTSFRSLSDTDSYLRVPIQKHNTIGEVLVEVDIVEKNDEQFTISLSDKDYLRLPDSHVWSYAKETIVINAGWDYREDYVDIYLTQGDYEIQDIRVYMNSYEAYEELVEQRKETSLQNINYSGNELKGTIDAKEGGLFFLSVPYNQGWKIKLDGEEIDFYEVNHAFIGFPIEVGKHELEMRYITPFLKESLVISMITFILLIVIALIRRKKFKRKAAES